MISAADRHRAVELIDEARSAGARLEPACKVLGIAARTYQRWTVEGGVHRAAGAAPGWYPLEALWFEFGHRLPLESAAPELFPALELLKTCWRDYLNSRGAGH